MAVAPRRASRPSPQRNTKPRWVTRTNSYAALLKACGLIFHRMLKDMRFSKFLIPLTAATLLVGVYIAAPAQQPTPDANLTLMKDYCAGCHSDKAKTGGVSFEGITAASIGKDPELFEKAVRKLRG